MKIAFICNSSFGIYNFRGAVIRLLISQSHEVVVAAPLDEYTVRLEELGCRVLPWELDAQGKNLLSEMASVYRLDKILATENPDLCFNFTIKPVIYGALIAKFRRHRVISVVTGLGYIFVNGGLLSTTGRLLYKLVLGSSQEIWFLNQDDKLLFAESRLLPNVTTRILPGEGIDLEYFRPRPHNRGTRQKFIFLMVARLLVDKGVREFVEAARKIKAEGRSTEFHLVGGLDEKNSNSFPKEELHSAIAEGLVVYHGAQADVREYIASSSCVVLPSYREGIPRVLLEAASMERAIITTDVPGCRDVVTDGVNGILCLPRSAELLAEAMTKMLDMPSAQRAEMGRLGRMQVATRFDQNLVAANYLAAIANLP